MNNKVSGVLTPESKAQVESAFQTIQQQFPFLIDLSPLEAKRIIRMEAGRMDFVRRALLLANANEQLRPQFYEWGESQKDLDLCQDLDAFIVQMETFLKQLHDTRDQAGHEAYMAALEIYNTSKRALSQGIPGAQNAYEDLRTMFEGQGKSTKPDQTPPQA